MDKLAEMIAQAQRPLLICGGGVVRGRADKEFKELAEKLDAPVAITVMGGGGFPGDHPLTTGMIGMHGSRASNVACNECDLLIAVGCRFSDRVALDPTSFASQAKIVQIDIDRSEIDKNVLTDHHIVGDAKRVLELLNGRIPQYHHTQWTEYVQALRPAQEPESGARLTPQQVLETIRRLAPQDTIVSTDVGQHQMWSIQHFHFDYPGQLLTSGGFGTMGFGLGAAIGAQAGNPDKVVVHTTGDGCFRMNCHELCTVEHYHLPIITVIFNNGTLGMVRQWQHLIYHPGPGPRLCQAGRGLWPEGLPGDDPGGDGAGLPGRSGRQVRLRHRLPPGYGRDGPAHGGWRRPYHRLFAELRGWTL